MVITDLKKKSTLYNTEREGIGKKDNFPADFISLYTNNAEVEKLHILWSQKNQKTKKKTTKKTILVFDQLYLLQGNKNETKLLLLND